MGIRETINKKKQWVTGAAIIVIVGAIALTVHNYRSAQAGGEPALGTAWFTTDDGQTWFIGGIESIPPFDHEGKPAYRAYVFRCEQGHEFAGYLQRFTAAGREAHEKMLASRRRGEVSDEDAPPMTGVELKAARSPTAQWVSDRSPAAASVVALQCPTCRSRSAMRSVAPRG